MFRLARAEDSTAVAILLCRWAEARRPDVDIIVLHGDALSEIGLTEVWARGFVEEYVEKMWQCVDAVCLAGDIAVW